MGSVIKDKLCQWWSVEFYLYAVILLTFCNGFANGIVASPLERQLEKFGRRVDQNEYVSVFKEPPSSTLNGEKSKTFVLLSKLFVLPSNTGEINEVLPPGGPLKFRRAYIPSSPTSTQNDQIFFPKEDDTSKKNPSPSYLFNKKPISSPDFLAQRKLFMVSDGRLTRYGENTNGYLNPVLTEEDLESTSDPDELSWYTLLSVPPKKTKKTASDGCSTGHVKDHLGVCRPIFHFNRRPPSTTTSPPTPSSEDVNLSTPDPTLILV